MDPMDGDAAPMRVPPIMDVDIYRSSDSVHEIGTEARVAADFRELNRRILGTI